jgi:hypothetical protein
MNATEAENMLAQLQQGRPKHAREGTSELDDLDLRLVETISWCTRYAVIRRLRRCLRPARLTPPPLSRSRSDAVERVISQRRAEFKVTSDVTLNEIAGQLLVYFPDANLADGAAEVASKDFFDVHNAPPCGTWIGYFEDRGPDPSFSSYVLAWVPQMFLEFARDGVDANPEGCIAWLSDTQLALRHILEHVRFGKGLT